MLSYRNFYIYEENNEFTIGNSNDDEIASLENICCKIDETVMVDWNMKHGNKLEFYDYRQDFDKVSYEDYIRHFVDYDSDKSYIVPFVYFTTIEKAKEFIDWIVEGDDEGYDDLTEEIENVKINNNMETIREQYDETLEEVERLIDNLKALYTDIINASESDNLTMENSDELDWMCLTVDSAMQSVEEVAQAMAR